MAKIGNASAIMKELLSNLLKHANPILNTVLGFKAIVGNVLTTIGQYSIDISFKYSFKC